MSKKTASAIAHLLVTLQNQQQTINNKIAVLNSIALVSNLPPPENIFYEGEPLLTDEKKQTKKTRKKAQKKKKLNKKVGVGTADLTTSPVVSPKPISVKGKDGKKKNKVVVKKKTNKVDCELCGGKYTKSHKVRHQATKKCKRLASTKGLTEVNVTTPPATPVVHIQPGVAEYVVLDDDFEPPDMYSEEAYPYYSTPGS